MQLQCSTVFFKSYFCLMGEVRSVWKGGIFVTFPFLLLSHSDLKFLFLNVTAKKIPVHFFWKAHITYTTTKQWGSWKSHASLVQVRTEYMVKAVHVHKYTVSIKHIYCTYYTHGWTNKHTYTHRGTTHICHKNKHSL